MLVQSLLGFKGCLRVYLCLSAFGFGFNYLGLRLLKIGLGFPEGRFKFLFKVGWGFV